MSNPPLTYRLGEQLSARPAHRHPQQLHDRRTAGERWSDAMATGMGSWRFIIVQSILVLAWIAINSAGLALRWDPYPFILLNLLFSTQASYAAPIIMMSQNRAARIDRTHAENAYQQIAELDALQKEQMIELAEIRQILVAVPRGNPPLPHKDTP